MNLNQRTPDPGFNCMVSSPQVEIRSWTWRSQVVGKERENSSLVTSVPRFDGHHGQVHDLDPSWVFTVKRAESLPGRESPACRSVSSWLGTQSTGCSDADKGFR
jgi:hypothetical protein